MLISSCAAPSSAHIRSTASRRVSDSGNEVGSSWRPRKVSRISSSENPGGTSGSANRAADRSARPSWRNCDASRPPSGPVSRSAACSLVIRVGSTAISAACKSTATAGSARNGISSAAIVVGTPACINARCTSGICRADRTSTARSAQASPSSKWARRICSAICAARDDSQSKSWTSTMSVAPAAGAAPTQTGCRCACTCSLVNDPIGRAPKIAVAAARIFGPNLRVRCKITVCAGSSALVRNCCGKFKMPATSAPRKP